MADVITNWFLAINPALAILIISLGVSLISTLALKYLTDQKQMKQMREDLKTYQKDIRNVKNNPKKMAKINEQLMDTNMKYMSMSMKPTLYTFIPIILIFGWLNANMAFLPIVPTQQFNVDAMFDSKAVGNVTIEVPKEIQIVKGDVTQPVSEKVEWLLVSNVPAEYNLNFHYGNNTYTKNVIITTERKYAPVEKDFKKGFLFFNTGEPGLTKITVGNEKIEPFTSVPLLRDIPWISTWNWFIVYILFSFGFSLILRKVLDVY